MSGLMLMSNMQMPYNSLISIDFKELYSIYDLDINTYIENIDLSKEDEIDPIIYHDMFLTIVENTIINNGKDNISVLELLEPMLNYCSDMGVTVEHLYDVLVNTGYNVKQYVKSFNIKEPVLPLTWRDNLTDSNLILDNILVTKEIYAYAIEQNYKGDTIE